RARLGQEAREAVAGSGDVRQVDAALDEGGWIVRRLGSLVALLRVRPDRLGERARVRGGAEVIRGDDGGAVRPVAEQDLRVRPAAAPVGARPLEDAGKAERAAVVEVDQDEQVTIHVMDR